MQVRTIEWVDENFPSPVDPRKKGYYIWVLTGPQGNIKVPTTWQYVPMVGGMYEERIAKLEKKMECVIDTLNNHILKSKMELN